MTENDLSNTILATLYEAWHVSDGSVVLLGLCKREEYDETRFWRTVERLESEGLIRSSGMVDYEILPHGIIYAERTCVAPVEVAQGNMDARSSLVEALGVVYDNEGPEVGAHYSELAQNIGLAPEICLKNLLVLQGIDYAEQDEVGCYRLSPLGLRRLIDYRKRKALAIEFEGLLEMKPQSRGRAFQKLFAKVVEHQGWSQQEGVRTSNEEMDVIICRGTAYYLTECKWEKKPTDTEVIRDLAGKLDERAGMFGMVVSMSGFTSGAVEKVQHYLHNRPILLFGPEDVKSLVYGRSLLQDMLDKKYRALVTKIDVIFE